MKIKNIIYAFIIPAMALTAGCEKNFDDLAVNPNIPAAVPAYLVFNGVLNDLYANDGGAWGTDQRNSQFYVSNYDYYDNNEYNFTGYSFYYSTLKNVVKMEEEAAKTSADAAKTYNAMGKFFRAYFFALMTQKFGDVPMTDALKGTAVTTPKYDAQKDIYIQIFKWLEDANTDLADLKARGVNLLKGDIYLNNDISKWQKVVNTFRLRALISLSKKESDADLNIKKQFSDIYSNPTKYPIMASMDDNLQYVYNAQNQYPLNPAQYGKYGSRQNVAGTYLNTLVALKDPRTFVVAEPADSLLKTGLKATDFAAYVGPDPGEGIGIMGIKAGRGDYSFVSKSRYYNGLTGENTIEIGYPEMCFNIAEAANRGWITATAEDWYKKGIYAGMSFYGITDAAKLDVYYQQATVKYETGAAGLQKIWTQKYLAFFQNSGLEAFFNQRRTGTPVFTTGVGTGANGKIPRRWQYPIKERTANAANYNVAVTRQFGTAGDDVNVELWINQ